MNNRSRVCMYRAFAIHECESVEGSSFVTASEAHVICRDKGQGRAFSAQELVHCG